MSAPLADDLNEDRTCGEMSCDECNGRTGRLMAEVRRLRDENAFLRKPWPRRCDVPSGPLSEQVGGDHYKSLPIQPVEFIHRNGLGFIEGCVVKYVTRWRAKGGIDDLKKARHFLDMLIAMEGVQRDE